VIARAIVYALGGKPDPSFFESISDSQEEAEDTAMRQAAERLEQEILSRHGWSG